MAFGGRAVYEGKPGGIIEYTPGKRKVYYAGGFRVLESAGCPGSSVVTPGVFLTNTEVTVGCTIATREVIEKLYDLFQTHYPKDGRCGGVTVQ